MANRTPLTVSIAGLVLLTALLACKKEGDAKDKAAPGASGTPAAAAPAAAAAVGGPKACIFPGGGMCSEHPNSDADDKKLCDESKGTWASACPTDNLVGTCKGLSTTKYYKPVYATANDAKKMCTGEGDKFTPAP